jgi:hypothetical protein
MIAVNIIILLYIYRVLMVSVTELIILLLCMIIFEDL